MIMIIIMTSKRIFNLNMEIASNKSLSSYYIDGIYLSSSRQMLEPIMEETSEDEEHAQNSWNGYDQRNSSSCGGFWSSAESETGSVIRVEITKG